MGFFNPVSSSRLAIQACILSCKLATTSGQSFCKIVVLIRIFDEIVKFNRGFEMEIGFKRDNQLPVWCSPAVLSHPGALGDVKFTLV